MIHASVKSYHSALFAFRLNILNSFPVLFKVNLPMSLIPMESLLAIRESVSLRQSKADDGLALAIPVNNFLSFYDSCMLVDAITVLEGLLLTLIIPLASQQIVFCTFWSETYFDDFCGLPSDGPHKDHWSSIFSYLWVQNWIVSLIRGAFWALPRFVKFRVCPEAFPTQIGHPSCTATL